MKACACADGADSTATTAQTAAIDFEIIGLILPGFAGKLDGRRPGVNPPKGPKSKVRKGALADSMRRGQAAKAKRLVGGFRAGTRGRSLSSARAPLITETSCRGIS